MPKKTVEVCAGDAEGAADLDARQAGLAAAGFRSSTRVVEGIVHVWSDHAYDALDPAEIRTSVTSAIERISSGPDAAPARDPDSTPGPVGWHTWVVD